MAKLIYDNSAMKHDTPDNSLQHWKYIKREKVNGKWRYTYKDDEGNKSSTGKIVSTNKYGGREVAEVRNTNKLKSNTSKKLTYDKSTVGKNANGNVWTKSSEKGLIDQAKSKINKAVTKYKGSKINRMTMEEWNKEHPVTYTQKSTDRAAVAAKKKQDAANQVAREAAKKAKEQAMNKASQETRTKAGKQIIDKAVAKDQKEAHETAVAKGKIIKERLLREAAEGAKKEAAKKEAAAEKQKQHEADVIKSMTDRKNAKLNEKKAAYDEAKAKRDAEAEGMRKAAKEFANRFLENRKEEAERKREEMRKRRRIH